MHPTPRLVLAATLLAGGLATATGTVAHAATCSDVQFVDARGTGEPGTLGIIVGDPVYSALRQRITTKSWSAYAVNYPADLSAGSASKGNTDLVEHLKTEAAACPAQTFVLGGYSQGANVVDNSMGISSNGAVVGGAITETIPPAIEPKVKAVLLFGNPIRAIGRSVTGTYASRTLDLCASGDPVCQAGGTNVLAHLSYTANATQAAAFAAART